MSFAINTECIDSAYKEFFLSNNAVINAVKNFSLLLATVVTLSLLTATTHYAFSEIDPIQINVSIPLEGSSEFCGKINTCFIPIEVVTLVGAQVTWINNDLALRINDEQIKQYELFFEQKCKEQRPYAITDDCLQINFTFEYDEKWYYAYPKLAPHHGAIEDTTNSWDPEYFTRHEN